jgi:glycosyltransferase involved in cell wall biosynthesis
MNSLLALAGPIDLQPLLPRLLAWHRDRAAVLAGPGSAPVTLLALELLRRGRNLLVVSLDQGITEEVVLQGPGLRICLGPCRPDAKARWRDACSREREWVRRLLERERPGAVHARGTCTFALGALDTGLGHLVTAQDAPWVVLGQLAAQDPRMAPGGAVRVAMAYTACRQARRLIATSPYVARHLQRYRFTTVPVHIIPDGLPAAWFVPGVSVRAAGRGSTFVAVLDGTFTGRKNGPTLLKAFARLLKGHPDARLVLFGRETGPGGPAVALGAALGCAGAVAFRGAAPHREVLACLAAEADVLVHPVLEEASGMTLLQGMACGLPCIAGQASGAVPWTLGHGEAGLLVDVRDPGALAEAMAGLAADPQARRRLGVRAQAYAREHYALERVVDHLEDLYADAGWRGA